MKSCPPHQDSPAIFTQSHSILWCRAYRVRSSAVAVKKPRRSHFLPKHPIRCRPGEQMRRMLRARDLHCRFFGCRAPAYRCDIDHTIDAAKGDPTSTDNLAHLCRGHHTLKHHGGWSVSQNKAGVMHWRSPTGRSYADRPPSRVRFTSASTDAETYRLDPANQDVRLSTAPF